MIPLSIILIIIYWLLTKPEYVNSIFLHKFVFVIGILLLSMYIEASRTFPNIGRIVGFPLIKKDLIIKSYISTKLEVLVIGINLIYVFLIIFSNLVISGISDGKVMFGILDIPFHICLVLNFIVIAFYLFYGYVKHPLFKQKYVYIFTICLFSIPLLLLTNVILPSTGNMRYNGIFIFLPFVISLLLIYVSNPNNIYKFNYVVFKLSTHFISFFFTSIYLFIVIFSFPSQTAYLLSLLSPLIYYFLDKGLRRLTGNIFNVYPSEDKDVIDFINSIKISDYDSLSTKFEDFLTYLLGTTVINFTPRSKKEYSILNKIFEENEKFGYHFVIEKIAYSLLIKIKNLGIFVVDLHSLNIEIPKDKLEIIESVSSTLEIQVQRHLISNKLEKSNEEIDKLLSLDKKKDDFLALTSHQLKTPLTIIKGNSQLLRHEYLGKLNEKQKDSLKEISINVEKLQFLTGNILNTLKINSNNLKLDLQNINIISLLKDAYEYYLFIGKNKGIKVKYSSDNKKYMYRADKFLLLQAILNILDNAISYTSEGEVKIEIATLKRDLIVKISDTGIGIPKEFKKELFKQFSRAENAIEVKPSGTGIGMYVSYQILKAHKVSIEYLDNIPNGTIVILRFNTEEH